MYRKVLSVYKGRSILSHAQDPRLLSSKCSNIFSVFVFRAALNVSPRAFGTTGVSRCEKKEGTTSPPLEELKNDGERTEELQVEGVELKLEKKTEKGTKVRSQKKAVENKPIEGSRTGKNDLLELLGSMKVEGTTKRKLQALRTQSGGVEAPHRPRSEDRNPTMQMFQQATDETADQRDLSVQLHAAASAAASTLPHSAQVESELLRQLRKHETVSDARSTEGRLKHETASDARSTEGSQNLSNIIADMKVRKKIRGRPNVQSVSQIKFDDDDDLGYNQDHGFSSRNVPRRKISFTGKRLNIFPVDGQKKDTDLATRPTLWDIDLANQIAQSLNNKPRNGFEEMIQWTRQGKLWRYPIDNEAGMEEEATVPFYEHVFLERHLEDGFPQQGPIRHFMELVITGLAKNHQLSVKEKVEHIAWFREYFKEKQDILKETDVCLS